MGPSRTMWLGWLSYAAIAFGFARASGPGMAWLLFLAFGLVAGLTESPERALVSSLAGSKQGTGFGVYHGATGVAALAGGILLGVAYQSGSSGLAFLLSAGAAAALALSWPLVSRSIQSTR
jgi:predicted MFS family arabinose efflux permease